MCPKGVRCVSRDSLYSVISIFYRDLVLVLLQPEGVPAINEHFPFHQYFSNAPQPLFTGESFQHDWEIAEVYYYLYSYTVNHAASPTLVSSLYCKKESLIALLSLVFLLQYKLVLFSTNAPTFQMTVGHRTCLCNIIWAASNCCVVDCRDVSATWARSSSSWRSSVRLSCCVVLVTASTISWWRRRRWLPWPAPTLPSRGKTSWNWPSRYGGSTAYTRGEACIAYVVMWLWYRVCLCGKRVLSHGTLDMVHARISRTHVQGYALLDWLACTK